MSQQIPVSKERTESLLASLNNLGEIRRVVVTTAAGNKHIYHLEGENDESYIEVRYGPDSGLFPQPCLEVEINYIDIMKATRRKELSVTFNYSRVDVFYEEGNL